MTLLRRMRPDFAIRLSGPGERVLAELEERLRLDDAPFEGQVLRGHACLRIPEDRRSLLSPHLELEARQRQGSWKLHGRFSPRPNVWTGFMAVFGIIAMLGLCGVIFGLAQMTVGGSPVWLLSGPAAVALIAFVYGAAFIGQGLSTEEMFELRDFVQRLIRDLDGGPDAGGVAATDGSGTSSG